MSRSRDPRQPPTECLPLVLGASATGRTRITGLRETEAVAAVAAALIALGVPVTRVGAAWEVLGRGVGGLAQPAAEIGFGDAGAAAGLLIGAIAAQPITVRLMGGAKLSDQPGPGLLDPLQQMGLDVLEGAGDSLPLTIRGPRTPMPLTCHAPLATSWLGPAVLLAGLAAPGETTVVLGNEADDIERMFRHFGAAIATARQGTTTVVTVTGEVELAGADMDLSE